MLGIALPQSDPTASEPLRVYFDKDWDNRKDVVVLGGRGAGSTARSLFARGVQRVIALLPAGVSDDTLPHGMAVARSERELWKRLIEFDPPPTTVTVRKIPNGGFEGDLHVQLADVIEKAMFNRATYVRKSEVWARHFLRNFRHIPQWPAVGCLGMQFAGKPCVVVSPGPSLAKNIDLLREIQDRVLLIASNRSVAPLCQAGIRPHLAIVSDPLDLRYQLPKKYLSQVGGLILDLVSNPKMFELNASRQFSYAGVPEVHRASFAELGLRRQTQHSSLLVAGGSVATTAFRLGLELGCTNIVMVGHDLALSGDQYYIPSAPDGDTRIELSDNKGIFHNYSDDMRNVLDDLGEIKADQEISQTFLPVRAWDGQGTVTTSAHFDMYRRYYEGVLPHLPKSVRVFNCTEGGAYIQGAVHRPLREVLEQLAPQWRQESRHPVAVIQSAADADHCPDMPLRVRNRLQTLEEDCQSALHSIAACEQVANNFHGADCFATLDQLEAVMSARLSKLKFITAICQPIIEEAQRAAANALCLENALQASRELYLAFGDAVRRVHPLVEQALRESSGGC